MWAEFERLFSHLSGLTFRVYDAGGQPLLQKGQEPPLCAFLMRNRKSRAVCEEDCLRQLKSMKGSRSILSYRCHGGLSYRIVPVRINAHETLYVLVGKTMTEVVGSEQVSHLARRYRLNADELEKHLQRIRFMSEQELDEIGRFVRRFARHLVALRRRRGEKSPARHSLQEMAAFGRHLLAFDGTNTDALTEALRALTAALEVKGLALLAGPASRILTGLPAAHGVGKADLDLLESFDWQKYARTGDDHPVAVVDRQSMAGAGLSSLPGTTTTLALQSGEKNLGRLVLIDASGMPRQLPEFAAQFLTARIDSLAVERKKEQEEAERVRIDRLGREIFVAPTVNEILPRALETAMNSFHARRGSILLAEEEGHRITACALRGVHSSLSGNITHLEPGSVTHKVFSEAKPFLVRDAGSELPERGEREFPYRSRSFVSVPLRENGHAMGVLHLTDRDEVGDFSEGDLQLLERLSLQTSMAIQKTRLKDEVQKLQIQALTDPLTGIFNRRHLNATLPRELQRADRFGNPLAIAFIDIDEFKHCNDTLGHSAGDQALKEVTACITDSVRTVDTVFRYGGEEFVVMLPETDLEGALNVAEKVRARIERESFCGNRTAPGLNLTVSVGVATSPAKVISHDELLERADKAQLEAKRLGKNRVLHWS